ncbi:MAG: phosphatidylserine decarboxylase, partial [Rhodanobacter sp.]|nr:phosphatidylserine decarboxylase [Rhodanobacter sp.]
YFRHEHGPFAVVLVGAMLVSGIEPVWGGVQVPPYASTITQRDWRGHGIRLARGAELGRFTMGSTVIVLLPRAVGRFDTELGAGQSVRVGQRVGLLGCGK